MKTPFFKGFALAEMLAAEEVSYRLGGIRKDPAPASRRSCRGGSASRSNPRSLR